MSWQCLISLHKHYCCCPELAKHSTTYDSATFAKLALLGIPLTDDSTRQLAPSSSFHARICSVWLTTTVLFAQPLCTARSVRTIDFTIRQTATSACVESNPFCHNFLSFCFTLLTIESLGFISFPVVHFSRPWGAVDQTGRTRARCTKHQTNARTRRSNTPAANSCIFRTTNTTQTGRKIHHLHHLIIVFCASDCRSHLPNRGSRNTPHYCPNGNHHLV